MITMDKKVQNLLHIIRFTPPILIIIACIIIISLIYQEQKKEFQKEKLFIETEYMEIEKNAILSNINTIHNYIKNEKQKAEELLKEDLKHHMDIVHNIASNIYNKNKNILSKDEIIKHIKEAVEVIRFNQDRGYFSIHTLEGINILHPINPQFEGTSVLNRKDSSGTYPVKRVINIAKTKGEGFATWYYFKPEDRSKEFKKLGIARIFEPLSLVITTAEYMDNYEKALKEYILNHISKFKYKNAGFIFVINNKGKILLHKSKKVLHHNIFKDKKFSHVKDFFHKLILKEDKNAGDFLTTIPTITLGKNTKDLKIIYAKKFDEWQWIIATSFKLSDANKIIEKRKRILEQKFDSYKKNVLLYGILFTIILLITSIFISKLIEKKFLKYKKNLESLIIRNIKQKETLKKAHNIARIGNWKLNIHTKRAYWSDEFIEIFGVENINRIDFGPKLLQTLIFKEDLSYFENSLENAIKKNMEHNCTYKIKRPDGQIKWIHSRGEINKEKTFLIGTVQDITESKKLELEKQEQENILHQQSKLASMGEMLGNIAHQWRQPLSAISTGATGAKLQKEMNVLSDENFNDTMDKINEAAQYLSQTIDDFRNFFDTRNSVKSDFLLSETINKTLNLVHAQFVAKEIEIIQDIEEISINSIENELIQVLVNILNNSRDALIKIEEHKRLIFINIYEKNKNIIIEIKDNANGIPKNVIDKIFEPYFTTKHQSQGTGIGLYMSNNIITKHLEGTIVAENESYEYKGVKYQGAKFIITINK